MPLPRDKETSAASRSPELELTYNWDGDENYETGRSWGHLAYVVDDIYATCQRLMDAGITINRPPREGRMAFVKSPDEISIELLQKGDALPLQETVEVDGQHRQLVESVTGFPPFFQQHLSTVSRKSQACC